MLDMYNNKIERGDMFLFSEDNKLYMGIRVRNYFYIWKNEQVVSRGRGVEVNDFLFFHKRFIKMKKYMFDKTQLEKFLRKLKEFNHSYEAKNFVYSDICLIVPSDNNEGLAEYLEQNDLLLKSVELMKVEDNDKKNRTEYIIRSKSGIYYYSTFESLIFC